MTKNQRKNDQKIQINPDRGKNISLENNEIIKSALNYETATKLFGFVNTEDFPELKTSSGNTDSASHSQNYSNGLNNNKSWLSVVSKGNRRSLRETFPTLPSSGNNQKNGCTLRREKDDGKLQAIIGSSNVVSGNAIPPEEKKAQNIMNDKESKPRPAKSVPVQPQRNPHKKKRSEPIFLNFQDVFIVHKTQRKPKRHNVFKSRVQQYGNKEFLSGNYLDSSNPKRNRGKHREIKKKKLTKLKLAIIKERILKQKIKEKDITAYFSGNECVNFIENTDFKSEIKAYLDELSEKKRQKPDGLHKQLTESFNSRKSEEQIQDIKNTKTIKQEQNLEIIVPELKTKKIPQTAAGDEIKFSSKFREYCDNILTPDLNSAVSELIRELVKLQDRLFASNPIKAKIKKRHVSGIREVKKYVALKKVKLIIIAPNLEKVQMEGGVYDSINELKSMADDQNMPYGFALDRYKLGRCTKKNVPVSAFAVLNYEGIEVLFKNTLHYLNEAKECFLKLTKSNIKKVEEDTEKEDVNAQVISSLTSVFLEGLQLSNRSSPSELE